MPFAMRAMEKYIFTATGTAAAARGHGFRFRAGIANLEEILAGRYRSETGLGMGIIGTKRLMDEFDIETASERHNRPHGKEHSTSPGHVDTAHGDETLPQDAGACS